MTPEDGCKEPLCKNYWNPHSSNTIKTLGLASIYISETFVTRCPVEYPRCIVVGLAMHASKAALCL
jgi:hypothetical protein